VARYVFDNVADVAVDRMVCLETSYDPVTRQRLADVGVGPGWRCLEIGAGGGSVARWLAERVGPTGSVLATDINPRLIGAMPSNVDVRVHDIVADDLPPDEFDLVHARLVLLHVPQRRRALERILHTLKPGGLLVLDEFDCTYIPVLAAPDERSRALFAKGVDAVHGLLTEAGADIAWGRNAYPAMAAAGFVDLDFAGWSRAWVGGSVGAALHAINLRQVGARLLDRNLISATEFDAFLELVASPDFTVAGYPLLTTWGRKP
jgi:SAM-dependent methyltransferase